MAGLIARGRLFLVSYAPLFAIFAARSSPDAWWPVSGAYVSLALWLALTVIGVVDAVRLVKGTARKSGIDISLMEVREEGSSVAGYLAAYLLPFLGTGPSDVGDVVGYIIYFAVLFVVFVRSDFAVVNPTLYVLGRRVVRAERKVVSFGGGEQSRREEIFLVCTQLPHSGDTISATRLAGCWVMKEGRREQGSAGDIGLERDPP